MVEGNLPPLVLEFDVDDNGSLKVKKIEGTLAKMGAQMDVTGRRTNELTGKSGKLGSVMDRLGISSKAATVAVIGLTAAAAGVATAVAGVTAVMIPAIAKMSAFKFEVVALARVTSQSLQEANEQILDLPGELGTPIELVRGYYSAISAGAESGKEALDLLTTASQAAKSAQIDLSVTIEALTKLMSGFQGEIKSASEASDLLFAIEQEGQTTFAQLAPVIGEVAALSKNVAVTNQEMAASFAQVTQTAGSTSQAATSVRSLFASFLRQTESLTKVLGKLNAETAVQLIQQDGLFPALRSIVKTANELGISYTDLFGSVEAVNAVLAIQSNNFQDVEAKIETMNNAAGRTQDAWDRFTGTIVASWQELFSELDKLLIKIGELSGTKTQDLLKSLTNIVMATQDWIDANQEWLAIGIQEAMQVLINLFNLAANIIDGFTVNSIIARDTIKEFGDSLPNTPVETFIGTLSSLNDWLEFLVNSTRISLAEFGLVWDAIFIQVKKGFLDFAKFGINQMNNLIDALNSAINLINRAREFFGDDPQTLLAKALVPTDTGIDREREQAILRAQEFAFNRLLSGNIEEPTGDSRRGTNQTRNSKGSNETKTDQEKIATERRKNQESLERHLSSLDDTRRRFEQRASNIQLEGVEKRINQLEFEKDETRRQLLSQMEDTLELETLTAEQRVALRRSTADTIRALERAHAEEVSALRKSEEDRQLEALERFAEQYREAYEPTFVLDQEKIRLQKLVEEELISQKVSTLALADARDQLRERTKQLMILEGDWVDGMKVAMMDLADRSSNAAEAMFDVWNTTFNGLSDQLTNFVTEGTFDLQSLEKQILSVANRRLFVEPLLGSLFGSSESGGDGNIGGLLGKLFTTAADGGVLTPSFAGNGIQFMASGGMLVNGQPLRQTTKRSGITDGPTVIAGEKFRREAFIPLPSGEPLPVQIREPSRPAQNITQIFNIETPDASTFQASQGQTLERARVGIMRAGGRR